MIDLNPDVSFCGLNENWFQSRCVFCALNEHWFESRCVILWLKWTLIWIQMCHFVASKFSVTPWSWLWSLTISYICIYIYIYIQSRCVFCAFKIFCTSNSDRDLDYDRVQAYNKDTTKFLDSFSVALQFHPHLDVREVGLWLDIHTQILACTHKRRSTRSHTVCLDFAFLCGIPCDEQCCAVHVTNAGVWIYAQVHT
jgi:hypothetical protein